MKGGVSYAERMANLNASELNTIIENHGKSIYGFCYKLTNNKEQANDLYQEAFLKALEKRDVIDGDKNPKSYIISLAIGLWKNQRRKQAWRQLIAPTSELRDTDKEQLQSDQNILDTIIINEQHLIVQSSANELKDKLKMPLLMFYTAQMSIEEISEALAIPKGTVKSRLHKARIKIRESLEASGYEEI